MVASSRETVLATEIVIDEEILPDGRYRRTYLNAVDNRLQVRDDSGLCGVLSVDVILAVMKRYARPLDEAVVVDGPALPLSENATLQGLRYRARVDACPLNYLVLNTARQEPVAMISKVAASALRFLVQRHGVPGA